MENKYEYLPEEMKNLKRFIGWRKEKLNGKIAKLPYSLINGQSYGWNNPNRWLNFEDAIIKNKPLGFVLVEEDNIICVDLDNSVIDSKLTDMVKEIISDFVGTYIELSQSGKGIHIFAKGTIPDNLILPSEGIEMYKHNRYIALTGNVGDNSLFPVSNILLNKQNEITKIYKKWSQGKPSISKNIENYRSNFSGRYSTPHDLTAEEILSTMERTNKKANALINTGSLTGDHSRDDFTFLVLARNYTNGNSNLMRELFLMTPLNRLGTREKRKDDRKYLEYVEKSLQKVLRLGNFTPFDWSRHLEYKRRTEAYERV